MGLCVAVTLPLEFLVGARVYRSPRRLATAVVPVLVLFGAWDVFAISRGHWTYSSRFVTGVEVGTLPLEEIVFFVVIPICALLTYEAVRRLLALARAPGRLSFRWPDGLVRVGEGGPDA
ncbi:lycopene cyclase domain-containing protein [Pseudactinotalea sp. HY158]|nr:lycopene cyclase domain-containing protein [Pseudactinotalea sp. HY158]